MILPALLVAALVAAPILSLLHGALLGSTETLSRLAATVLPDALLQTGLLLGGIAVLTGILGVGTAWLVTAFRFPGSREAAWLLPLPLAVPTYITAFVYVELLDAAGPVRTALRRAFGWKPGEELFFEVRSLGSCIVLMSFVLYPYVYVAARAAFLSREPVILAAARTLGAPPLKLFLQIAIPLARPAIAAGITLALLEALNDIGAAEYLGVRTLTVSAYTAWLNGGDLRGAAQIACVTLAVVIGLIVLEGRFHDPYRIAPSAAATSVAEPRRLRGRSALLAQMACAIPIVVGFVVPAAFLALEILRRDLAASAGPDFGRHVATTVALAAIATAATLLAAAPLVIAGRLARNRRLAWPTFVAGLGYAIPGTLLVLGLLHPLIAVDSLLGGAWEALTGREVGLVLMGSGAAIVIAYLIRFLRIGLGAFAAQLASIPPEVDHMARTLGARPLAIAWRIHAPLLRPAIGGAALLVFVDCLKELPATLLLRPLNVETLATLVYGAASRGAFEDGALAAMLIIAAGIGPVIWLTAAMQPRAQAGRRAVATPAITPPSEMPLPLGPGTRLQSVP